MLSKWLERLRGGSGSSTEATEPVTAPEPAAMPEDAPSMPAEADASGGETAEPAGDEPAT